MDNCVVIICWVWWVMVFWCFCWFWWLIMLVLRAAFVPIKVFLPHNSINLFHLTPKTSADLHSLHPCSLVWKQSHSWPSGPTQRWFCHLYYANYFVHFKVVLQLSSSCNEEPLLLSNCDLIFIVTSSSLRSCVFHCTLFHETKSPSSHIEQEVQEMSSVSFL